MNKFLITKNHNLNMKFIYIFIILLSIGLVSAFDFPHTQVTIDYSGNLTNLSDMLDVNIPAPTDNYVLSWDSASSMWIAVAASAAGDTNETTRFNTLVGTNCGAGEYAYGVDATGLVECRADAGNSSWNETWADTLYAGIGTGGNTSWNESWADTLYSPITEPLWADNFTTYNTTWSTDTTYSAGSNLTLTGTTFAINITSLVNYFNTLYSTLGSYLTQAVTEISSGDNYIVLNDSNGSVEITLNETYLNLTIDAKGTGDNSSWNETYADTLYSLITEPLSLHLNQDNWYNDSSNYLYWDGDSIEFNQSKLATTYYNATQSEAIAGTIDGGTLSLTQHPDGDYDGITFNFSEASGSPGLDLRINFTGVSNFNKGYLRYKTNSLSGDYPAIQLWDYDSSEWEGGYGFLSENADFLQ